VNMDVTAYLRREDERFDKKAKHVKDFSVFDFNYIPSEPLMRDEVKGLLNAIIRFRRSGIPTHQAIIGSRGSGKTLMLKYLAGIVPVETGVDMVYANCRHHSTSFRILAHLVGERTQGASLTELYARFLLTYPRKTVVILDEVDLMSPKDRHREILYLLSRSERPYMVVMLSNSPHVLKQLDAATRSSLQPEPVHFKDYDAEQIKLILRGRAQRGLYSWEEGDLAKIAALTTSKTNADARVAIKTLCYAACRAYEDLETCFEKARRDIVVDVVNDLADQNLAILWAVATSSSDLAKNIYQRYCRFSQNHREKPFSYVYFYANLSYLQSAGLIALVSTKVDRAYTNRILLTIDRSVVESITKLRFG
jgi:cell division control protein 6